MNIIIDTHIFLWLAEDKLSNIKQINQLKNQKNNLYISSLSIAEISIKASIGKLIFDGDILETLRDMDVEVLDFDAKSAVYLKALPLYHRDPFDRMIISQAISGGYVICTNDEKFVNYGCELL